MDNLKNLLYLIPVMIYYFIESMFTGLFVTLVWRAFLAQPLNVYITYFQWVAIIWIIKVLFFDVFKLISAFMFMPPQNQNNENNNSQS
jgi:hypothetical protein